MKVLRFDMEFFGGALVGFVIGFVIGILVGSTVWGP